MNGYLLDTNTALFSVGAPNRLSGKASAAILSGPNILSVVSYWEVTIKSMKGKLDVGDPRAWWIFALERIAAEPLLLRPEHIAQLSSLPLLHRDPFDRMLISQGIVEGLTLVTSDAKFAA